MAKRGSARLLIGLVPVAAVIALASGCGSLNMAPGSEGLLQGMRRGSGPPPIEAAAMAVDPYNANNRALGTMALATAYFAGNEPYIALFEDNIKDPESSVRAAAARGLANHGEAKHAPLLAGLLKDPDAATRLEAARGLQRLHNPEVVSALLGTVDPAREAEASVRVEASLALGQYKENRVVRALIAGLGDDQLAVNRASFASLRSLTGQDFGLDRAAWTTWLTENSERTFASAMNYEYPIFKRDKKFYEYLPFMSEPPNETSGIPAGYRR